VREPTADECSDNALIEETETQVAYAIWYPQMGGYHGKAVVAFFKSPLDAERGQGKCFDALVWHSGTWPFHDGEPGRELHHCNADQFVEFGEKVLELQAKHEVTL
jgi:hypothetical protein